MKLLSIKKPVSKQSDTQDTGTPHANLPFERDGSAALQQPEWNQASTPFTGPYFSLADAARYCGYKPSYFLKLMEDYRLPRVGPKRNRIAQSVLDAWMSNPGTFHKEPTQQNKRRTLRRVEVQKPEQQ